MRRQSRPLAAALLLGATLAAAPAAESQEIRQAAAKITEDVLRAHTKFLASDLLEGRGPATRGDALAEAYLQAQMEGLGLKPGAPDGGWIQKVPLVGVKASFPGPALFRSERGSTEGTPGGNFVAFSGKSGVGIARKLRKWFRPNTRNGSPTSTRATTTAHFMTSS